MTLAGQLPGQSVKVCFFHRPNVKATHYDSDIRETILFLALSIMRHLLLLLILAFFTTGALAQTGDIRGFVYEQETSEPAIYTSVYLKGTTNGVQTNLDGYYSITRVPPGDYVLMVTSVGFDTIKEPITIKAGDILTKKLYLRKSAIQMKEIEISGENEEKKTEVKVSVNKVTPKEIKQLPTVGGEPDLAQYLQVLPGVIFSGDQGGQLYIRGGTPIQNKVLLDGMIIYNPFHSIGLYSVFDADIIRGADVYTGGFNAEYGDRISSVMDITTRDGNKKRIAGRASVNPFTAKFLLEGPLKKEKENQEGSSSFIITSRNSYLDKTSKSLYSYVDTAGLPFAFNDLYGKISLNSSSGSKVNFFGFNFTDRVNYKEIADLDWKSFGLGTNFVLVPSGSSVLIDGNFAYSNYRINLDERDEQSRFSEISGFNTSLNFSYFIKKDELRYGLEIVGFRTDFQFSNAYSKSIGQTENTTQLAGYFKYKKIAGKLIAEPGIRINYYSSLSELTAEPRLGLKFNATDKLRFKAAGGYYSQNLLSGTSDRDVVNLFYGFLSGSDNIPETFDGEDVTSRLQKAQHAIAGFEIDLPFHLNLNVEGYFKNFSQLQNLNRDKVYDDDSENSEKPDYLKKDFIIESGTARGIDFLLKYDYRGLYLWATYSLGYVKRYDGVRTYWPSFDRRHNLNLVGSYTFGKDKAWMTSVRWNFGSPFPFTQSQGYYEQLNLNNGLGTDILQQNGQIAIYYAGINEGRLSYFHRLDVSVQRSFKLAKNTKLEVQASATNLYDRNNIFYFDRLSGTKVYQLPILPSLGAALSF
jgi:hypothetical protein